MFVGNFLLVSFLRWWYGDGLNQRLKGFGERLARTNDFFSVGLLARTLFSPFRQLSDAHVSGPLEVKLRAFFDDIVSRLIGGAVRSTMIFASFFVTVGIIVYEAVVLLAWLVLPVAPVIGVIVAIVGMTV